MSSVPANFKKGTQTAASFKETVKRKNKKLGIFLGVIVIALMSLAMLMKG
tara:strand:- start:2075 stop:2224 length:150 start_codon:yes stop_codon:yes gene_type:complete